MEYDKPQNPEFHQSDENEDLKERLVSLSTEFHRLLAEIIHYDDTTSTQTVHMFMALDTLQRSFGTNSKKLIQAQQDLAQRLANAAKITLDQDTNALQENNHSETQRIENSRFSDHLWQKYPLFDFLSQSYLVCTEWLRDLITQAENLSDSERQEIQYYLHQLMTSLSPANNFFTNPVAIQKFVETKGRSLEKGLENLIQDYDSDYKHLNISQSDMNAFEIGKHVATTKGQIVFKNELIELIRFDASQGKVYERPLLIFPPWINKYYVLDLQAKNSLIAWLRDQGFTVYVISWRNGDNVTRDLNWDDYAGLGGLAAIEYVYEAHKTAINIAGYCIGGTMLSTLSAYLFKKKDQRINSLTFMSAQTDFSQAGMMNVVVSEKTFSDTAAAIVKNKGLMPGELMSDGFNTLRPQRLIWQCVENNYLLGNDVKPFDLLFWNGDQTNIPGPLHLTYLQNFYLENQLPKGEFTIFDEKVSLSDVTCPVFIHAAAGDHIAPYESVYKGRHLFGGPTKFILAESGHIAGVVNPPINNKYGHWSGGTPTLKTGAEWKASAKYQKRSWWPALAEWLSQHSGEKTAPPQTIPGAPPAPGEYVKTKLADIHQWRKS